MIRNKLVIALVAVFATLGLTAAVAPQAQAAQAPCRSNVYGYGGTGKCVKALQAIVSTSSTVNPGRADIGAPIARDGSFGSKTRSAVRKYQRINHLKVDGRVGPQTWKRFCSKGGYWGDNMSLKRDYKWAKRYAC